MGFGSVGTDTGGSIRIPAAACGIVGLKPTLGELPCDGVVPLSTTLDHVGPLARSVADASLLFQAMKCSNVHGVAPAGGGLTFGVPRQYFFDRLEPEMRASASIAPWRGCAMPATRVRDIAISGAECTPDVYLHICLPEASCHHAATLAEHADQYSPGVRLRLEMGRYILAEDYVRAMRLRAELTAAVDRALEALRRAAAADAADSGAADRRRDGGRRTASKRRCARRCSAARSCSTSPAIRRLRCRRAEVRRDCRAACSSSAITAGPSGCSISRRPSKTSFTERLLRHPGRHFELLSRVFHQWERRLAAAATDRVVRPFEWGMDWLHGDG